MPIINFNSFNAIKPKKVYRKQKTPKYTTIQGEVIGICRYSLERKRFEVLVQELEEFFPFTIESYCLKNIKYCSQLQNNKIIVIDEILPDVGNNAINCMINKNFLYLPFMAGIFCKGVLVTNNINKTTEFQLQNTTIDWNNPIAKKYIKEYINNYEEIKNVFRKLQFGRIGEENSGG